MKCSIIKIAALTALLGLAAGSVQAQSVSASPGGSSASAVVGATQVDMNSPNAVNRLQAELAGAADPVILAQIASKDHVSVKYVKMIGLLMQKTNGVVTPAALEYNIEHQR